MSAARSRPAQAFGVAVPYSASVEELRARVSEPNPKAWAAILALGHKPEPAAVELLIELTTKEWSLRNLAIQSLGIHPLGAQGAQMILAGLSDSSSQLVRTSCDAAANLRLPGARPKLKELLKAQDPQIRLQALRALSTIWSDDDFSLAWDVFKKDKTPFVRQEAALVLKATISAKTWRTLFDRWKRDPFPKQRVWACELLAEFGRPEDMKELLRLVRDPSVHVRLAAEKVAESRGFGRG